MVLRYQQQAPVNMAVGRDCNFCDFVDEAIRVSQGVCPLFQTHNISHGRASPYAVLMMGRRFYSAVKTSVSGSLLKSLNTLFSIRSV